MLKWWRTEKAQKFLRETGTVVFGVLIALGLGAIATEIGWRIEVWTARSAMSGELGELIGQAEERVTVAPCIEKRLDELSAIVRTAETAGRLPPLGAIATPPLRTWPMGVWQSTLSETAAHIDHESLDNYSTAYDFAAQLNAYSQREIDVWTRLYALSGPGRAFTSDEAGRLRDAIAEARLLNRLFGMKGMRMKQVVIAYDLGYDTKEASIYGRSPAASFEICRPISPTIPAEYGQAPLAGIIDQVIANPISPRDDRPINQRR